MPVDGNHFVAAADASVVCRAVSYHAGHHGTILHIVAEGNAHRGALRGPRGRPIVALRGSLESSFITGVSPICGSFRSIYSSFSGAISGAVRTIGGTISSAVRGPI